MHHCMFYFHGCNLVCKMILDLQLHNETITGFGFCTENSENYQGIGLCLLILLNLDNSRFDAQPFPILVNYSFSCTKFPHHTNNKISREFLSELYLDLKGQCHVEF